MSKNNFFSRLIDRKNLIIMLMLMVFAGGIFAYIKMPKQHFPKVILPIASVSVVYPGADAEDIEQLVAEKVEHTCMELEDFDNCETHIYDNYCVLSVSLNMELPQEQVDREFDELKDKLEDLRAELPSGVTDITVNTDIMDTAGVVLAVSSDSVSNDELSQRSNELSDKLRLIDGVRKVSVLGDTPSQVTIKVDIDKLNNTNVSFAELSQLIAYHNATIPVGDLEVDGNHIKVSTDGRLNSLDEIENIVVSTNSNHIITRLGDIAEISTEVPDDKSYYIYNNKPSTVIALYFQNGINVVDLGDEINAIIDEYNSSLPTGIEVNRIFLQPDEVSDSINNFVINLLESIILVIIVIMIGMNFRNAVVVSFAIPLSIFAGFISTYLLGYQIHFVSLASLIVVLGMLVDNAVVVSDAIQKNIDAGMEQKQATVLGVQSVYVPVFVSMLTTVLAFSSLLMLPGVFKQLSRSFPVVIISCLVASYIVSIFVTPLISYLFLRKSKESNKNKNPVSVRAYQWLFNHAFKHKAATIAVCTAIMLLFAFFATKLDRQVVPMANKDIITIQLTADVENSLEHTREIVDSVKEILDKQPETQYYLSGIGTNIPRYDYSIRPKIPLDNSADIFVRMDFSKGNRFKNASEMVDYLQNEFDKNIGGADIMVDELGIFALNTKPVEMKIYSEDIEDLNTSANMIYSMMKEIGGTKGIVDNSEIATYNYFIKMDNMNLNTLGLMEAEALNELNIAVMGRNVTTYRSGSKEYDVILKGDINSADKINTLKVKSSVMDKKYSVSQFAEITLHPEISTISRINGRRGRVLGCYVGNGQSDIDTQTKLENMIEQHIDEFPESITIEKSGKKKVFTEEVLGNIAIAAVVAILAILIIMILQFGSFKKIGIVFISVPFGIATGFFALFLTNQPMSLFALIGAVSLLGCVLSNAIVLIDCITNELSKGLDIETACRNAGGERLRPILMSTMTTVLGLMPLALFGDDLFVPMAILMLSGLLASMCVNLVLVPIVYFMVYKKNA